MDNDQVTRTTKRTALLWAVIVPVVCALAHPASLLTFFLFPVGLARMAGEYTGRKDMSLDDSLVALSYLFYLVTVGVVLLSSRRVVFTVAYAVLMVAILFNVVGCHRIMDAWQHSSITAAPNHTLQRTLAGSRR